MRSPEKPKPSPPEVPRWAIIVSGCLFLWLGPIDAIRDGSVLSNIRGTREGAIRVTEAPFQFWIIVSVMFLLGFLVIVLGILKRGRDA